MNNDWIKYCWIYIYIYIVYLGAWLYSRADIEAWRVIAIFLEKCPVDEETLACSVLADHTKHSQLNVDIQVVQEVTCLLCYQIPFHLVKYNEVYFIILLSFIIIIHTFYVFFKLYILLSFNFINSISSYSQF